MLNNNKESVDYFSNFSKLRKVMTDSLDGTLTAVEGKLDTSATSYFRLVA